MDAGASLGLQSLWRSLEGGRGGFDSLTPPPIYAFKSLAVRYQSAPLISSKRSAGMVAKRLDEDLGTVLIER